MKPVPPFMALLALVVSAAVLAACGGGESAAPGVMATPVAPPAKIHFDQRNRRITLTIGSKNFTEQRVLGEIYARGLRAAGYNVRMQLDLGDERAAFRALRSGRVDAYPEYTGTALLSFFGQKANQLPKDPRAAYEEARRDFARDGLVAFPPTPFTSSNEVAVTSATARKLGLEKISDLAPRARQLTLYGSPECRRRLDCLLGLERVYGLRFKSFVPVDIAQRHRVLASGRADVSIVFTTDPQIQREDEVLLEDDRGMFPPYNSTLVMRRAAAKEAGTDLRRTLLMLQEQLTDENMQELNARVDLDKQAPAEVAKEYLTETGLVAGR